MDFPTVCWPRTVHDIEREFCDLNPATPEKSWFESEGIQLLAASTVLCLSATLIGRPEACLTAAQALFWQGKK